MVTNSRPSWWLRVFFVGILLLSMVSVPAGIRSMRSRAVTDADVQLNPNARITIPELLNHPMVVITVVTDNVDENNKVKVEFRLDIDSADEDWDKKFLEITFIAPVEKGRTNTFSNNSVINDYLDGNLDLDDYKDVDFEGDYPELEGELLDYIERDDLPPEGKYTMKLTVTGWDKDDNEITSTADKTFYVVRINNARIPRDTLPTIGDPYIRWELPQVPAYSGSRFLTRSNVSIINTTTRDTVYSALRTHTQASPSFPGSIKGYPGGTDEGKMEIKLPDNLILPGSAQFRMGESYALIVDFRDWNNARIDRRESTFSFSSQRPVLFSPRGSIDGLRPTFEWGFGEYEAWAGSYRLYMNGNLVAANITDTSYELTYDLAHGEEYTWYVEPFYHDDSNRSFGVTAEAATFTTPIHLPPEAAVEIPSSGDKLLVGETYTFSGQGVAYEDTGIKSEVWTIDNRDYPGAEISYTPAVRYPGNSLQVTFTVTDEKDKSASENVNITVLDPVIAAAGPNRSLTANQEAVFTVNQGLSRDYDEVFWNVYSPEGTDEQVAGEQLEYTFTRLGTYAVEIGARAFDSYGGEKEVIGNIVQVAVESEGAPVIEFVGIDPMSRVRTEQSIPLTVSIISPYDIAQTTWKAGTAAEEIFGGRQETFTFTPTAAMLGGEKSRTVTIICTAEDEFGDEASTSLNLMLINPQVSITNVSPTVLWPLENPFLATIEADFAQEFSWYIEGDKKTSAYRFPEAGFYELKASAQWMIIGEGGGLELYEDEQVFTLEVIDRSPPEVRISAPTVPPGSSLVTGVPYEFIGEVVSGTIERMWWTIGSDGLFPTEDGVYVHTFAEGSRTRNVEARFFAESTEGIEGSASRNYTVVNPVIRVSWPTQDAFAAGAPVQIQGVVSAGELLWSIDGETYTQDLYSQVISDGQWDRVFAQPGSYTIQPGWSLQAVGSSGAEETFVRFIEDESFSLTIYSMDPPRISSVSPEQKLQRQRVGTEIHFEITAESVNELEDPTWVVRSGSTVLSQDTGNTFSYSWDEPGAYTVEALVRDVMGQKVSEQWSVRIIDPNIAVVFPESNRTYGDKSFTAPEVTAESIVSYQIYLNGDPVEPGFSWTQDVPLGSNSIYAIGQYSATTEGGELGFYPITSDAVPFTITALPPPEITVEGIANDDRLIAGLTYVFTAEASGADGAEIDSIKWYVDNTEISDSEAAEFSVASGQKGKRSIRVVAEDEHGLITTVRRSVTIIDPRISIVLPELHGLRGVYPAETAVTLRHIGQDIDEVTWVINGSSFPQNTFILSAGRYTIKAVGSIQARLPDGYGTYSIDSETEEEIRAYVQPTLSDITVSPQYSYAGTPLQVSTTIEGVLDSVQRVEWLKDGIVVLSAARPQSSVLSQEIPNPSAGTSTLRARVIDIFGRSSSSEERSVTAIRPLSITIESPQSGDTFGPHAPIPVRSRLSDERNRSFIHEMYWSIGNIRLPNSDFFTGELDTPPAGENSLSFTVIDKLGEAVTETVNISVQSDLMLSLITPRESTTILEGTSITCRASAQALTPGVTIASNEITWYVDADGDEQEVGQGLSYTFGGFPPGTYQLQARYDVGDVFRETRSVPITVAPVDPPVILSPTAERVHYYAVGQSIPLVAEGYPDASFRWMVGNTVVGRGRQIQFFPEGLEGAHRLTLEMEYQGITRTASQTIMLEVNNPPQINVFTAPSIQYTGSALTWNVSAMDLEDGTITPTVFFNGIALDPGAQIILTDDDLGVNELRAVVRDSAGASEQKQITIIVEKGVDGVEIVSPQSAERYIAGRPITLLSRLIGDGTPSGTYSWSIQYLDTEDGATVERTGSRAEFIPEHTGAVRIAATFTAESAQQLQVRDEMVIQVSPEPVTLSLYWPHGGIVNAGSALEPQLVGISQERLDVGTVEWLLNGRPRSLGNLTAPELGGEHTLTVRFIENDRLTARDEVVFQVNERPKVTITSPAGGAYFEVGTPIIFTAEVEDDQPFAGSLQWLTNTGEEIGGGSTIAVDSLPVGHHAISAIAVDQMGARNRGDGTDSVDQVALHIIEPLRLRGFEINNGVTTYLLTSGIPIPVSAEITGGDAPQVSWTLRQGDETTERTGDSVALPVDLDRYRSGSARLILEVSDRAEVRITENIPLQFVDEARADIISPEQGVPIWAAAELPVRISTLGFASPEFRAAIDGEPAAGVESLQVSMDDQQGVFDLIIPCPEECRKEGVYNLEIIVSENNFERSVGYTMNVFTREPGVTIVNAPERIDLLEPVEVVLGAEVFGLTEERLLWYTPLDDEPAATGEQFALTDITLPPGRHRIEVHVVAPDGAVTARDSVFITVLGDVKAVLTPAEETIAIRQGAQTEITVQASDRDGEPLTGEALTWSSHRDGVIGTGEAIQPGLLDLAAGEHMVTLEAVGSYGISAYRLKQVVIRAAEEVPSVVEEEVEKEERITELPGGSLMDGDLGPIIVSTATSEITGEPELLRNGTTQKITMETSFTDEDSIILHQGDGLWITNTILSMMVELSEQGTYNWNSSIDNWSRE